MTEIFHVDGREWDPYDQAIILEGAETNNKAATRRDLCLEEPKDNTIYLSVYRSMDLCTS